MKARILRALAIVLAVVATLEILRLVHHEPLVRAKDDLVFVAMLLAPLLLVGVLDRRR